MLTKPANVVSGIPRAMGLMVIEVRNSNPNGDPDRDGAPRVRRGDIGEISPVSVKRKMRDLVANKEGPVWQYLQKKHKLNTTCFQILEDRGRSREEIRKMIVEDDAKPLREKRFVQWYWDGRVFGNTFLEGNGSKKEEKEKLAIKNNLKTGVMHFGLGLSVAPVTVRTDFSQTSKAGVQEGKSGGMAPGAFRFVEYGIYTMPFFISPTQASRSGCTRQDIDIALELVPLVYAHNPAAFRSQVEIRHIWYAEHASTLGSFSELRLIDVLTPALLENDHTAIPGYRIPDPVAGPELVRDFRFRTGIRDLMAEIRD